MHRIVLLLLIGGFAILTCAACGGPPEGDHLSENQRQWLAGHPDIRLAADPDYPPIDFFDDQGRYSGLSADYIHRIEQYIGRKFRIVRAANFSEALAMAQQGQVDIICTLQENPHRSAFLLFTDPVVTVQNVIITRSDRPGNLSLNSMQDLKIVLVKSHAVTRWIASDLPALNFQTVPTALEGLMGVSFGLADAIITELPTASYLISQKGISNLRVSGHTEFRYALRIGVRKDWPVLYDLVSAGMASISPVERQRMWHHWIMPESGLEDQVRRHALAITAILFALASLFTVIVVWNRALKRKVALRTGQLDQELKERIAAEESLRNYEKIVSSSDDFLALVDNRLGIRAANDKICQLFQLTRGQLIGRSVSELAAGSDFMAEVERLIQQCPPSGKVQTRQWSATLAEGRRIFVDITVLPRWDEAPGGGLGGFVISARDITQNKMLEDMLQRSMKMEAIGTLAGGIAHDFNNILSAVLGYSELAQDAAPGDAPIQRYLAGIIKAGERAKELVRQILTFSRQTHHDPKPMQLAPIVKETLKLLRASLPATIDIRERIESDAAISADPTQMHQVLMNLCTNAAHAMRKEGGTLSVSLSVVRRNGESRTLLPDIRPGPYVRLSIGDTGHGIPAQLLDRIFDPFFTTKLQGDGTGLGLSMVHGIVKSHGGDIDVETREGAGTEFHVYMPIIEEAVHMSALSDKPAPRGSERILFVDDEVALADIAASMLTSLGYQVTREVNSHDALTLFRTKPFAFDLVITDFTMPKMTGEQLAAEISRIRADIPIILCTGYSVTMDDQRAAAMGIRAVVMKPVLKHEIAQTIRKVLDVPQRVSGRIEELALADCGEPDP
jgi:two-component system, cell cycle sensor histidine kinase and response regulator CckA